MGNVYDFIVSSHRKDNDTSDTSNLISQVLKHWMLSWCSQFQTMARWSRLDSIANTYLIRYHVLSSDRSSQEEPRGLLLNQSKGFSYTAGFTMVRWLRIPSGNDCFIHKSNFILYKMKELDVIICKVTTPLVFSLSSLQKFKWSINWVHWVYLPYASKIS